MIKYCLAVLSGMLIAYFIGDLTYAKGFHDGIMREKYRQLDNRRYKLFLEETDIPDNYRVIPKKSEIKL